MEHQFLSDSEGHPTVVLVPIDEWNDITSKLKSIEDITDKRKSEPNLKAELVKRSETSGKKKPSDFAGTLSKEDAEKLSEYVKKSREEWGRSF